jgi:ribosomal protein S18 acetylase RimI-like enzyme
MEKITFRPIQPKDMDFLYQVYTSTRKDEMALTGWPEEQIHWFLQMQFNMQHTQWTSVFPEANFMIIVVDGVAAGRLYLDYLPREIHIIEITLLPEYRNQGLGTKIIQNLMDEARQRKSKISLCVEKTNPAYGLYQKMGFARVKDSSVYYFLEWTAQDAEGNPMQPAIEGELG